MHTQHTMLVSVRSFGANLPASFMYQVLATVVAVAVNGLIVSSMSSPTEYLLDHFCFRPPGSSPFTDDVITIEDTLISTMGLFNLLYFWLWLKGWYRFSRERMALREEHPALCFATQVLIIVNAVPLCAWAGVGIGVMIGANLM